MTVISFLCAKTASRYSSPSFLLLVSNQRALTAAWKLQSCCGSGKSWRNQGILYCSAAALSSGLARAQSGHSRSPNSTMATRAPAGGCSGAVLCTSVLSWAAARTERAAGMTKSVAARAAETRREADRMGILLDAKLLPLYRDWPSRADAPVARFVGLAPLSLT